MYKTVMLIDGYSFLSGLLSSNFLQNRCLICQNRSESEPRFTTLLSVITKFGGTARKIC